MISHMMPIVLHGQPQSDWWELEGESRTEWISRSPKEFLEHQEARYREEAASIRCRGANSPAARKKARMLRLADAIRFSIDNNNFGAADKMVGNRWVFSVFLNPQRAVGRCN